MPSVNVTTADPEDAARLAPRLRSQDLDEIAAGSSADPAFVLRRGIEGASLAMSVSIDGRLEALFGVNPLDPEGINGNEDVGVVWLLASDAFYENVGTVRLMRQAVIWLERMQRHFPILMNVTLSSNEKAIQWLAFLGFSFTMIHPHYGAQNRPFIQFERSHHV